MFSVSICDDDQFMRDKLENIVHEYFVNRKIGYCVHTFSSGEEFLRYKGNTDIAFLDVEMKRFNGIETGYRLLKNNPNVIIFIVTNHTEYLDEAMDLRVFRFIEKPADKNRVFKALEIITEQSEKLSFISNHLPVVLRASDIVCIYSYDRKTFVLTDTGESYPTILSVKDWLRKTEGIPCYSHPHYSYIINMKYVSCIDKRKIILKLKTGKSMSFEASQRKINDFKNDFASVMRNR